MLGYKIKKAGGDRIIHIILEDNYWAPSPTIRPPTENEIKHIVKRERRKKVDAIIKEYNARKTNTTPSA